MKKYTWIVALLIALSLVVVGCDTGGGTKKPTETNAADRIDVKFTQDMLDVWGGGTIVAEADGSGFTFTYGTGSDASHGNAVAMFKLDLGKAKVRDYEKATFTFTGISGDLNPDTGRWDRGTEKGVNLLAADNKDKMKNFGGNDADLVTFIVNAFTGSADGAGINAAGAKIGADQPATKALELAIAPARPQAKNTGEVWFSFYLHASPVKYTAGSDSAATDEKTSFKITNVSFVPLKTALGDVDGEEEEEEVIPPPVFDDTVANELTHTNPVFIKYAGWGNGFTIEGDTATIPEQQQANFAYTYPTTGYTLGDWDFVTLNLTTTGTVSAFGYKNYNGTSSPGGDTTGITGSLTSDADSTIKLEIMKNPLGLGFQKYAADANPLVVKINSATFTKGTRRTFTLNADGGTGVPTTFYLVDGTTVANHLPVPTKTGFIFLGWKNGANFVNAADVVGAALEGATLIANWKAESVQAAQKVTFNTTSGSGYVRGYEGAADTNGPRVATVTLVNTPTAGIGYTIETNNNGYGNAYAFFSYTFTGTASLSDFTKVTFTYKGIDGDISSKTLKMIVGTGSDFNYVDFDARTSPISTASVTGENPIPITMNINQGLASAYDGQALIFAIGFHGSDYEIQITDVEFSQ